MKGDESNNSIHRLSCQNRLRQRAGEDKSFRFQVSSFRLNNTKKGFQETGRVSNFAKSLQCFIFFTLTNVRVSAPFLEL